MSQIKNRICCKQQGNIKTKNEICLKDHFIIFNFHTKWTNFVFLYLCKLTIHNFAPLDIPVQNNQIIIISKTQTLPVKLTNHKDE